MSVKELDVSPDFNPAEKVCLRLANIDANDPGVLRPDGSIDYLK